MCPMNDCPVGVIFTVHSGNDNQWQLSLTKAMCDRQVGIQSDRKHDWPNTTVDESRPSEQ